MDDDRYEYTVLINDEEQYSLWPTFKPVPKGWRQVGPVGKKADCLAYVEANWTDMRPLGVRQQLEKAAAARAKHLN